MALTMRKRPLYQNKHSFPVCPFEAFHCESWRPVNYIQIKDGTMSFYFTEDGFIIAQKYPFSNLRISCRKATMSDCTCILRPGAEISALSSSQTGIHLMDAKLYSVQRRPHEYCCKCIFMVKFYVLEKSSRGKKKILSAKTNILQIHEIYILQKLGNPSQDTSYRWDISEDCSSHQKSMLSLGKFASDLTWLVVTSALKQKGYIIRSMDEKIVYQVMDNEMSQNTPTFDKQLNTINFQVKRGTSVPVVFPVVSTDSNGKNLALSLYNNHLLASDIQDLRRSKRKHVQPDRYLGEVKKKSMSNIIIIEDSADSRVEMCSRKRDLQVLECSRMKEPNEVENLQPRRRFLAGKNMDENFVKDHNQKGKNMDENCIKEHNQKDFCFDEGLPVNLSMENMNFSMCKKNVKDRRRRSISKSRRKYYPSSPSWPGRSYGGTYSMKPAANAYDQLMKQLVESIKLAVKDENPKAIEQWRNIIDSSSSRKIPSRSAEDIKQEASEIDLLWKEMELCMFSNYLSGDDEGSRGQKSAAELKSSGKSCENFCNHRYRLKEELGIVCECCGYVSIEIKYVLPPFVSFTGWTRNKRKFYSKQEMEKNLWTNEHLKFSSNRAETESTFMREDNNIWMLFQDFTVELHCHQKKAFEFLWNNIAGSLQPWHMDSSTHKTGGCVLSHSPGAGKTLLVMMFLVTYLKLFPGKRPLVLAPKTTLYTWHKEVIKWKVPMPVYQIYGCRTYISDLSNREREDWFGISTGGRKPRRDVRHALDCLQKIQKWHSHPSILLMSYTSFQALTREDSRAAHRKYMGQVLKESPGILVLDEGHNPRNTRSRLRKALMKVKTNLRILLSGTLFQNNFAEYFNTLCLARPAFINEVLLELDPNYDKNKKCLKQTQYALQNRARKCFIDGIANRINSDVTQERRHGLDMLRSMTGGFIDFYEGFESDRLHGLQCYTLLIKPTALQSKILVRLQNKMDESSGYPMELELLITLGSIHPWLIKSTACVSKFFNSKELEMLEEEKHELNKGSKMKFVVSLVRRSVMQTEKVLIFCHNIAPMNLFVEIFEWLFGWRKNVEILVLSGEMELFERGRVMDRFEDSCGGSRVMLASISACAEGISLTAASRVVLVDTVWNPSKRKQAIARAFRPGQQRAVYVYQLLSLGTMEEDKYGRTTYKEWVSSLIFSNELMGGSSSCRAEKIDDDLLREIVEEDGGKSIHTITRNEKASHSIIRERVY